MGETLIRRAHAFVVGCLALAIGCGSPLSVVDATLSDASVKTPRDDGAHEELRDGSPIDDLALNVTLDAALADATGADVGSENLADRSTDDLSDAGADADVGDAVPVDAPAIEVPGRWACPRDWVVFERGGCGPAVVLCATDGGAAPGACDGLDITRPHDVTDADGGVGTSFYRLPDGGIGGAWSLSPWTCPPGWRALPDGTCDPAVSSECPTGSSPLPAGSCTSTALRECPVGAFADVRGEIGTATPLYVVAGTSGGDGSETRPFATITEALGVAADGAWVLVGAGTYREALSITRAVHIVGRCAAGVSVEVPSEMADVGAVSVTGSSARVDLRGLTIVGRSHGVRVAGGASLTLRQSAVVGARSVGVLVEGSATRISLEDLRVVNTVAREGVSGCVGVRIDETAGATMRRVAIEDNQGAGLVIAAATGVVELSDSSVRRTQFIAGQTPAGVLVSGAATVNIARTVIADNPQWGVIARGSDLRVNIEHTVIARTSVGDLSSQHGGLGARDGAQVRAHHITLSGNVETGANTRAGGALLELTDALVTDTREPRGGEGSNGLSANASSTLRARRVVLRDNESFGAVADTEFGEIFTVGTLELTDSLIVGMRLGLSGQWGTAIGVRFGGRVRATRVLAIGLREFGIGASAGAGVQFEDVILSGTTPATRGFGVGIGVGVGADVRLTRVAVLDVHGSGLATDQHVDLLEIPPGTPIPAAHITGTDFFLRGVRASPVGFDPRTPGAPLGVPVAYGVSVGRETSIDLSRAVIAQGGYGFALFGPLSIREGVVTGQDYQGFRNSTARTAAATLERVSFSTNLHEAQVVDDTLPEGRLPSSRD